MRLKKIYDDWKEQREQRKKEAHEQLLRELADMVDQRRAELRLKKES